MTEKFIIGIIGAPYGLDGFVKVHSPSGETDHLLLLTDVIIRKKGEPRRLIIEENKTLGKSVLMRFAGIDSPEAARALSGAELLAGREQASPLHEGEFYIEDLKGLAIRGETDRSGNPNGEILAHIRDIVEGGGGELAELELLNGEIKMVPFRQEFFSEINLQKGFAVLKNLWILE